MRDSNDAVLENLVRVVAGEGTRFLKEKAFGAALRIVQGIRRIFIIHYVIMFLCFLSALAFFASAYLTFDHAFVRMQTWSALLAFKPLIFCGATFILSSLVLALSVRESAWVRASGLAQVYEMNHFRSPLRDNYSPSAEEIAQVVEDIVDRRLGEFTADQRRTQTRKKRSRRA